MSQNAPLKFVTLPGRLRAASLNAVVANSQPQLAPAGVEIKPLGSIADFPHYDADIQVEGFPEAMLAMPLRQRVSVAVQILFFAGLSTPRRYNR
ncbi:hypothetical protein [Candidatus Erwinia dacicola]|uniref:Chromate reductase domain protein n=1 Tax=Candidatus Erwinia dacicola TaxID=252393 RepID=A0A1E7YWY1_9GAMM|nr:hypothetical protein BBW68_14120 [Candidatus Erwinia dacicola]RAP70411.1 chromate reductase domain protein [Candidatus Erwinia dacicola]